MIELFPRVTHERLREVAASGRMYACHAPLLLEGSYRLPQAIIYVSDDLRSILNYIQLLGRYDLLSSRHRPLPVLRWLTELAEDPDTLMSGIVRGNSMIFLSDNGIPAVGVIPVSPLYHEQIGLFALDHRPRHLSTTPS